MGCFRLAGTFIKTGFAFCFLPKRFANTATLVKQKQYLHPTTFMAISFAALAFLISASLKGKGFPSDWFNPEQIMNPFLKAVVDGLTSGSATKILLSISPAIGGVGLFAYSFKLVAFFFKKPISFENSLSAASYFVGTIGLFYFFLLPLPATIKFFSGYAESPVDTLKSNTFLWVVVAVSWVVILRCFYSYLHFAQRILSMVRLRVVVVITFCSMLLFYLFWATIMCWFAPTVIPALIPD